MAPLLHDPGLVDALLGIFAENGVDLRGVALGFARATPAVTLVPAFGLGAIPPQTRLMLGLAFGSCLAPALASQVSAEGSLLVGMAREALVGLPVALVASLSIYVAAMAGGLVDDLRGARESITLPSLPEPMPPVAVLFALFATVAFLETGGASRVVSALASPDLARSSWPYLASALAGSVELAFAIAAPIVVSSVLLETASALIARAATPAFVGPAMAPLKSVVLLGAVALVLERIVELLALLAQSGMR